jgi:DNA-binding transcriptional LysR family regulator
VISTEVAPRIRASTGEGVMACVRAGLGLAIVSEAMAREELAAGEVVRVLEEFSLAPVPVHAVFPAGPRPSAKVRALVDHLAACLKTR